MRRLNKLIPLFFLSLVVLMIAIWTFVQSEYFSYYVNRIIEKSISRISNLDFTFNKLDLQFFPPGVNLKSVKVSYKNNDIELKGDINEVGVFFNNPGILFQSIDFRSVKFQEGKVSLKINEKMLSDNKKVEKADLNLRRSEILKLIKDNLKISLSTFLVKDIQLKINNSFSWIKRIDMRNKGDFHQLNLQAYNSCYVKCDQYSIDTLELESLYFDDTVDVKTFKVMVNQNTLESSGIITNLRNVQKLRFDIESSLNFDASSLHDFLNFKQIGEISQGLVIGKIKSKGKIESFKNIIKLKGYKIISDFANAQLADIELTIDNDSIRFNRANIKTLDGELELLKGFELFNFNSKLFVEEPILAEAKNVHLNNILKFIRDSMGPLKGNLSGKIKFSLFKDYFVFENLSKIKGKNVSLVFDKGSGDKLRIFNLNQLRLDKARFEIRDSNLIFTASAKIDQKNRNSYEAEGIIGKSGVDVKVENLNFELGDLNGIGGVNVSGRLVGMSKVSGPLDDVTMSVTGRISDGSFENIKIGKSDIDLDVFLNRQKLVVNKLNYHLDKSKSKTNLEVDFKQKTIKGTAETQELYLADALQMYSHYTDKTFLKNAGLNGELNFKVDYEGDLSLKGIKAIGKAYAKDIYLFNENIQQISSDLTIENGILNLKNTNFKLFNGIVKSKFAYDMQEEKLDYSVFSNSLRIEYFNFYNSLPLNLKSRLVLKSEGVFNVREPEASLLSVETNLVDSILKDYPVPKSNISLALKGKKLSFKTNIFGRKLDSSGEFDFSSKAKENLQEKNSYLRIAAESNEVKTLVDFLDFIKIDSSLINGTLLYEAKSKFNVYDPKSIEFTTHLKNLFVSKGDIFLNYQSPKPEISVSNGVINKWDININGQNIFLKSQGDGDFKNKFKVDVFSTISASFLDIFKNYISSANGVLNFQFSAKDLNEKIDYGTRLFTSELEISPSVSLTQIKQSNIDVSLKNNILRFDKFDLFFNKGSLIIGGDVNFEKIVPTLKLNFLADKISYPILDKTEIIASGKGELIGRNPPYTVNGKLLIDEFNIFNDFIDFTNVNKDVFTKNIKYLPEKDLNLENNLFNFNINVETLESINIVNSMANLKFFGDIYLLGNEKKPRLSGRVELLPGEQKVFFKNNEFNLSKGQLTFLDRKDYKNPDLDIQGASVINDYNLEVKVYGDLNDPVFDLSSDPPLAKNDILSLIAFGYTQNISENLTSGDREALTQAGVGGILFDQLKINETLKNEFGLKVNLGTEFDQDSQNFLGQRSGSQGVSRTRSATKVELRKDINKAMDLSVSSTIGGSIGSKQSMILNYELNKDISVDGVYEIKSNEEGEQNLNIDSVGFDVKYRKSFK